MMTLPSVSVIMPSYNQAAYLEQSICSVLSQNIPGMEFVIMDGGSKDGSVEIIRRYEDRLAGWVSEKDGGQADAVNKGIACTSGEVIAWLNSDDLLLPGTLEKVLTYFAEHPEMDAVYGDVISIDADGKLFNVMRFAPYTHEDLMTFRIISQPGVFFRRSLWEKSGGLDLSYSYMLDHHLWLRMSALGKFDYIPQPFAAARYHAEAKNRAHTEDFGKESYRLAEELLTDPATKGIRNRILGGAAWMDAHYLSDGGMAWKSLKAYAKAFRLYPERVLEDKKRVALTFLMLFSRSAAEKLYADRAAKRAETLKEYEALL